MAQARRLRERAEAHLYMTVDLVTDLHVLGFDRYTEKADFADWEATRPTAPPRTAATAEPPPAADDGDDDSAAAGGAGGGAATIGVGSNPAVHRMRVRKAATVGALMARIEAEYGVPVAAQRLWSCALRENGSIRPDSCVTLPKVRGEQRKKRARKISVEREREKEKNKKQGR